MASIPNSMASNPFSSPEMIPGCMNVKVFIIAIYTFFAPKKSYCIVFGINGKLLEKYFEFNLLNSEYNIWTTERPVFKNALVPILVTLPPNITDCNALHD